MRLRKNILPVCAAALSLVLLTGCSAFSGGIVNNSIVKTEPKNLFEVERELFNPAYVPMETSAQTVSLKKNGEAIKQNPIAIDLNGDWQMIEGGTADTRKDGNWTDEVQALPVTVPTTVTQALIANGRLPGLDSIYRMGQIDQARGMAMKDWWFKKTFQKTGDYKEYRLVFEGTSYENDIYLNGVYLGSHKGLSDRHEYDVTGLLREENTLVVLAKSAQNQKDWKEEVFIHSCNGVAPHQGIWRPVYILGRSSVATEDLFVATRNANEGLIDLFVTLRGDPEQDWKGSLTGTITSPDGKTAYSFSHPVEGHGSRLLHLQMKVPEPELWWPAGMGEQPLYTMEVAMCVGETAPETAQATFGIRTIEMTAIPDGEKKGNYNWQMLVNGKEMFIKGACYNIADVLLYQNENKYEYLAKQMVNQNMNFIRAMGSGMPQPDEFYDVCDKYGILVYQEWPAAWDSIKTQPYDVMENTVKSNMLRLRNHPSLAMWGGGNELSEPIGEMIDMMGRYAWELDGTRPFLKTTWYGGGEHNYSVWHQGQPLDSYLENTATFYAEFGQPAYPNFESVLRYLPEGTVVPETMTKEFLNLLNQRNQVGEGDDSKLELLEALALPYLEKGSTYGNYTLKDFIQGTQMSQALSYRHTIDLMRANQPESTGTFYFRFTDEQPIVFWSVLDSFGAPKMAYYFIQDSYDPVHAAVLFETFDTAGKEMKSPVVILDDYGELEGKEWQVKVSAYNASLQEIKSETYTSKEKIQKKLELGEFTLSETETASSPLFIVSEVLVGGVSSHRTFYWLNFQAEEAQGAILHGLPQTTLDYAVKDGAVTIANTGDVPAVGVHLENQRNSDSMIVEDNFFWLNPGEERTIQVSIMDIDGVSCWNEAD